MSFKSDVQTFSRSVDSALRKLNKTAWRDPTTINRDQGGRFSSTNTNDGLQQRPTAAPSAPIQNAPVSSRGVVFDTGNPNVRASNEWAVNLKDMYEDIRQRRIEDKKKRLEEEHRRWRKSLFRRMFRPEPPRGGPLKKPE